jgi:hypothetical protein
MPRIVITIPPDVARTLYSVAERERRNPRDQAALLLTELLRRREQAAQRRHVREREVACAAS